MKPLIRRSDLTDPPQWYVITRYRQDAKGIVEATKYDVTDQIEAYFPRDRSRADSTLSLRAALDDAARDAHALAARLLTRSTCVGDFETCPSPYCSRARAALHDATTSPPSPDRTHCGDCGYSVLTENWPNHLLGRLHQRNKARRLRDSQPVVSEETP